MTVGVLGGGQLGRMIALAGYTLGQRFVFLDPGAESSAGHVGNLRVGAYDDEERLSELARKSDVVTYEFENVPVGSARFLNELVPVYPPPAALEVSQDRLEEKQFFERLGIPTPAFAPVSSREELDAAVTRIGLPAVIKTRRFGYDGKGQMVLRTEADVARAWEALGAASLIVEGLVPFERELSILAVRGKDGETRFWPLVENEHRDGVLRVSVPKSDAWSPELQRRAEGHAARVMATLGYVGVLAIELFMTGAELVANEMAPRVHNSGHWTIEGAETSQFENHVRAILGLPLGSTRTVGWSAMLNVIGKLPPKARVLAVEGAHLHAYGKDASPGRKLGHVTVRAESRDELHARIRELAPIVDPDAPALPKAIWPAG
ncbi:MAG: 5-(carboxyamino)imidazole ribonucleotide synthase [Labilithrix sp.]|nr:5-(carboxyamino)imidazole ribonucleotide synthase [Labilithrix sp.]MCW5835128.1 5-(carboxyamino)imidazole ribonucleotide synthase [Labilithrix sp.]